MIGAYGKFVQRGARRQEEIELAQLRIRVLAKSRMPCAELLDFVRRNGRAPCQPFSDWRGKVRKITAGFRAVNRGSFVRCDRGVNLLRLLPVSRIRQDHGAPALIDFSLPVPKTSKHLRIAIVQKLLA